MIEQNSSTCKAKRPLSVTIIGWFLIVRNCVSLVQYTWLFSRHPESSTLPLFLVIAIFAYNLVLVITGCALLLRQNWARYTYVCCFVYALAKWLPAFERISMFEIFEIAVFVIVLVFLFRPNAAAYFTSRHASSPDAL